MTDVHGIDEMTDHANPPRPPLILTQIAARLHEIFDGHIDLVDVEAKTAKEKEAYFLTRSYLALYFLDELGLSAADAASCITDGGADDGIDGVYVDAKSAKIYFGQSKWRINMSKGVELNDFVRFRDGVRNVISLIWNTNNANIHRFRESIEQQLSNIDTEVSVILAHTSEHKIAENIISKISQFIDEENKFNAGFVRFKEFRVLEAAKVARSATRPENINLQILMAHWGLLPSPYKAVYGSVAGTDVVAWFEQYGNKLFAENLRYGIEKSSVNDGIFSTAHNDPESFWYYNNGITAICENVVKQPIGGPDTSSGVFDVTKISVINGAQTITSLTRAKHAGADLARVRVHLRVISLSHTPDEFAPNVTSANNTQNDLSPVDFVAADHNQDRIRREAMQQGLVYAFRRGDKEPDRNNGFTIRSATIAAACASGDLRIAVSAKRYISGLWENTKKEPYTRLFNADTTAAYLWRVVQVMNVVDDTLLSASAALSGREKLTAVHGNRFILFYVFEELDRDQLVSNRDLAPVLEAARGLTGILVTALNEQIAILFPDSYVGNVFKNQERQLELLTALRS